MASGKTDSIVDAPAIVSSYSRADLESLASHVEGHVVVHSSALCAGKPIGTTAIGVRGISMVSANLLLLIDESPY